MRVLRLFIDSFVKILVPGLTITIPLAAISFSAALVIGLAAALVQVANVRFLNKAVRFYIWIIRGTPLLAQLFVVFFGLPGIGIMIDPFPTAVIVFSVNEGAYLAESLRAAIEAIDTSQIEAGLSLGLPWRAVMRLIVLPQAFRIAFPTLSNTLIAMVKDTSIAASITVAEMFMVTQRIVARTYEPLVLYLEAAFIYLMFCTILTKLQAHVERKLKYYD